MYCRKLTIRVSEMSDVFPYSSSQVCSRRQSVTTRPSWPWRVVS